MQGKPYAHRAASLSCVRSRRAPPVPLIVLPKSCSCRCGPCPPPLSLVWVVCFLSFFPTRLYVSLSLSVRKSQKERKQTIQGRDGRTARRHLTGILRAKKERKKTDTPREAYTTKAKSHSFLRKLPSEVPAATAIVVARLCRAVCRSCCSSRSSRRRRRRPLSRLRLSRELPTSTVGTARSSSTGRSCASRLATHTRPVVSAARPRC